MKDFFKGLFIATFGVMFTMFVFSFIDNIHDL
jgi:hypothetical protein